jgi:multidrug resistance protein, MATE family
MVRLAAPLALAELSWMTMGIVDTVMAGPLGAAAVGAGGLAGTVSYPLAVTATGLLLGMDTLVAQAFGGKEIQDCRRTLVNGLWLAAGLAPLLIVVMLAGLWIVEASGPNPDVMELFRPFYRALLWGIPALLLFTALRRYLQAVDVVKPVTFAMISANVINFVGNWMLMYGHWGAPPMGLTGSGWSTSIARWYMALVLVVAVVWKGKNDTLQKTMVYPTWPRVRRLIGLGLPAAGQIGFEGGVWAILSVLAARLDAASLAAHSITCQIVATTYMVPLGVSSAAAVRVGQAVGRRDANGAATAGWAALLLSSLFMGAAAVVFWTVPRFVVGRFIEDAAVIAVGAALLKLGAIFELFDGLQATATGALRGLGDTKAPMIAHMAGYWVVGLPTSYWLCFRAGWGVRGIWVGLTAALVVAGAALVIVWARNAPIASSQVGPA